MVDLKKLTLPPPPPNGAKCQFFKFRDQKKNKKNDLLRDFQIFQIFLSRCEILDSILNPPPP